MLGQIVHQLTGFRFVVIDEKRNLAHVGLEKYPTREACIAGVFACCGKHIQLIDCIDPTST